MKIRSFCTPKCINNIISAKERTYLSKIIFFRKLACSGFLDVHSIWIKIIWCAPLMDCLFWGIVMIFITLKTKKCVKIQDNQVQGTVWFKKIKVKSEKKKNNDRVLINDRKKKLKETVSFHLNQEDTRHGLESLSTWLVC